MWFFGRKSKEKVEEQEVREEEVLEETVEEELIEEIEEVEETEDVEEDEEDLIEEIEEVEEDVEEELTKEPEEEEVEEKKEKKGFFAKLTEGLTKTRDNIMDGVDSVLGAFTKIDEDLYEELEEALIMADLGVSTTMNIMDELREQVKEQKVKDPSKLKGMIVDIISSKLSEGDSSLNIEKGKPTVMLVIGVNGVGKTTTIGKLASQLKSDGNRVLLAAADTFRAAAIDQLEVWGERSGVDVIKQYEGADPSAVVYDAIQAAKSRDVDVLICDTAGRLHNKTNLMKELEKTFRVIDREFPEANKEVLLVLDATTGQNAISQAQQFKEVADITGIALTKLDGTAKGGIIVAIHSEMEIPVKFIGVGEQIDDLQPFNPEEFTKALFGN